MIQLARQECEPVNVQAWLFRAVRFQAINIAKMERRRLRHHHQAAQQRTAWFELDMTTSLAAEELTAALESIPTPEREIVIVRTWGNLSYEKIAELVGSSTSAVHRRYQSALVMLRDKLEGKNSRSVS